MSKTSLYDEHVALNAKIVDFAGWDMPIQYKNLKEEVKAIRENIGVFDVSHMGEFFVEGPQALEFVDYLVTNDILGAENLKAVYSPLCREDGTIIDDLIVYKISNTKLMICVNAGNIDKDFSWMKEQAKGFDLKLSNRSDKYSLLAVQGPETFKVLKSLNLETELQDIDYYSLQIDQPQLDTPIIFARTGYTGEDGFEIFAPHEYIKSIWKQLMDKGVAPCGLGSRDVLRLEVCYPLYGHELNDDVTPLDSTLKWTVKLNKKSFIGKEFLENYVPTSRLIKFTLEKGIPREGYPILDEQDKKIGSVTSGTMSVVLGVGIAIARVEKESFNKDSTYFVEIRNKKLPIKYVTKPFITGGHK
jgi:aminomethyltransferase